MLTNNEADILRHTARTGRYVTGDAEVIALGKRGLLHDHGPQALARGDHYFTLTEQGRAALREWQATQPKAKPPTKRQRRYRTWRTLQEIYPKLTFRAFLTEPAYQHDRTFC